MQDLLASVMKDADEDGQESYSTGLMSSSSHLGSYDGRAVSVSDLVGLEMDHTEFDSEGFFA